MFISHTSCICATTFAELMGWCSFSSMHPHLGWTCMMFHMNETNFQGKQADFSGPAELQWLADLRWNVTLTCARSVTNKVLQTTMKLYTR